MSTLMEGREAQAIMAAILAEPGVDLPRLAMADFLDESGEEARASFIRCQLRLAQLGECGRDFSGGLSCRCPFCRAGGYVLSRREGELLASHEGQWLDWLKAAWGTEWVPVRDCGVEWRRGFVSAVALTLADFMRPGLAAALFAAAPIESVRLACRVPYHDGLWGWNELEEEVLEDADEVPAAIWSLLDGYEADMVGSFYRWYRTEALARSALSTAAVKRGRRLADLPEVPHE